jgi:uncharacterized protein YeaO (DUF488 family)
MIYIKRVYEAEEQTKGKVFLVDRIWPRGMRKEELKIEGWLKEVAPSTELRRWFHSQPEQWFEFKQRYYRELDRKTEAWKPILEAARSGDVTLLYSSKDTEHNNAVALKAYLEGMLGESGKAKGKS